MLQAPNWYDEKKLEKACYGDAYTGWVINLGDGTCRLVNHPLLGEDEPSWGDRVGLIDGDPLPRVDASDIRERYGQDPD